jgi:predicted carbohydrate-binding protein with CBM5 and CBM33 domain
MSAESIQSLVAAVFLNSAEAHGLSQTSGTRIQALCADADGCLGVPAGQTQISEEQLSLTPQAALPEAIVQDHVVGDAMRVLAFRWSKPSSH